MLYPVKDFKTSNEFASLQNQVKEVRLQDKLSEQNYHYDAKQLQEPLIDTIEDTSEKLTKTMKQTYNSSNKSKENLNEKILELMKDKGMIAPYKSFLSLLVF